MNGRNTGIKTVAIIGVGLIGGSLGMALRAGRGFLVRGIGRNRRKLALSKKLGAVDEYTTDYAAGLAEADIVVICTPVDAIADAVEKIIPFVKPGAVITDAGSSKKEVTDRVGGILKKKGAGSPGLPVFVGAHPMAGSEKAGVRFSRPDLFRGATVAVTVETGRSGRAVREIAALWRKTGAKVVKMSPGMHDRIVASTSHLPHVIAFNLCLAAGSLGRDLPRAHGLMAGSFRDLTRIADSNPRDWAAICRSNRRELEKTIDAFVALLKDARNTLSNANKLEKMFVKAKAARHKLLHTS